MKRAVRPKLPRALADLTPLAFAERVARDPAAAEAVRAVGLDPARAIVDAWERGAAERADRKSRGVFYTPSHVVEAMLDRVPLDGVLLDPASGAGAFVVALAQRLGGGQLHRLHACDLDPGALDACAFALEAALGPAHRERIATWRKENTHARDFLRTEWPGPRPDLIVGNPPYGRFDDGDLAARFPELAGERDLYACFVVRAVQQVARAGTVALLIPDTWLTNTRSVALRRFIVASTRVAGLADFGKPFTEARDTRVHALFLRAERQQGDSRATVESDRGNGLEAMAPVTCDELARTANEGWRLYRTSAERRACRRIESAPHRLGDVFEVIYGLRTGDNARYVRRTAGMIPLVGGEDFDAFDRRLRPKSLVEPAAFGRVLERQRGRWKLGVQRIRTNSLVSWRRWVEAAPLRPDEVGLDSLTLLADRAKADGISDELACLLGVLNSAVLNRWYRLTFTDVNVKPAYLATLPLPEPDPTLAMLVRRRLDAPGDLRLERAIDRVVADAYGLTDEELDVLEAAYWGEARSANPLPSPGEIAALANGAFRQAAGG